MYHTHVRLQAVSSESLKKSQQRIRTSYPPLTREMRKIGGIAPRTPWLRRSMQRFEPAGIGSFLNQT
jgi:hypothetical protein